MSQQAGWYYYYDKNHKLKAGNTGTSFQTIPKRGFEFEGEVYGKDIRRMFIPGKGKIFIDADGSNAEGHVVCVLAEDWETLEYMISGNDLHKLTASWILMLPINKIQKPSFERDLGKTARHAGNLGQGPNGLSLLIHKPRSFCDQVMKRFHAKAPKVHDVFHFNVENNVKNHHKLINPFGRRRDFFDDLRGHKASHVMMAAYSFLPQSTVTDHYKKASLRIEPQSESYAGQLFEAHDGLMWEVDKDRREEFIPLVYHEMTQTINFKNCTLSRDYDLKIPVEMGESTEDGNWKDMKDISQTEIDELTERRRVGRVLV
jgi:DNA polymerase-1